MDELRDMRGGLQTRIREWADDESDADMVGWWKDPEGTQEKIRKKQEGFERDLLEQDRVVKLSCLENSGMAEYTIPPTNRYKRASNERGVLTC